MKILSSLALFKKPFKRKLFSSRIFYLIVWARIPYWRKRFNTVDLLLRTSLDQLILHWKYYSPFLYKTSYTDEEVNGTEPSLSVSVPCLIQSGNKFDLQLPKNNEKLPNFTEFYQILPNFTKFYQILPNFTKFYQILPNFTKFYQILLYFTKFYWILLNFTEF